MAPLISPVTATIANGIKYQVGSAAVSAPIGSLAIASLKVLLLPASALP